MMPANTHMGAIRLRSEAMDSRFFDSGVQHD